MTAQNIWDHRLASYDISLVVSGGGDCGRRRRNVYDKKPQRYAKDNRTAHLTTRSDKSVAYVTNDKRLLDVLYCWSEQWQTRSIARPLCDSRATCNRLFIIIIINGSFLPRDAIQAQPMLSCDVCSLSVNPPRSWILSWNWSGLIVDLLKFTKDVKVILDLKCQIV